MISKPLLKQSLKANGYAWLLVTMATALMLGIIVMVLGNLQANEIRDSLRDTFIESELESQFKSGAIEGYRETLETVEAVYPQAKQIYDLTTNAIYMYEFLKLLGNPDPKADAIMEIKAGAPEGQKEQAEMAATYVLTAYETQNIDPDELHEFKSKTVIDLILLNYPGEMTEETRAAIIAISGDILDLYALNNELTEEDFRTVARLFVENIFYQNLLKEETEEQKNMLSELGYESMPELLNAYGFTELKVRTVVQSGLLQYISYVKNGMSHEEALKEVTGSLLSEMPEKVGKSLQELGELNINHLVIGSIFFKIAGLLLPIVYTIMTSNNLIAGQVDSGSMAFVLSTPTKRRKVAVTQMVFLVGSLILMFLVIGAAGVLAAFLTDGEISISYGELLKLSLGALCAMIAIGGICFLASAWFNRSKHAMGIGGGLSMFFLVSTILGLFGSTSIPEALRIQAMDFFNYTSIISFFNVTAILEGGSYIFGLLILLFIGAVTYTAGILRFDKKDLPL